MLLLAQTVVETLEFYVATTWTEDDALMIRQRKVKGTLPRIFWKTHLILRRFGQHSPTFNKNLWYAAILPVRMRKGN